MLCNSETGRNYIRIHWNYGGMYSLSCLGPELLYFYVHLKLCNMAHRAPFGCRPLLCFMCRDSLPKKAAMVVYQPACCMC